MDLKGSVPKGPWLLPMHIVWGVFCALNVIFKISRSWDMNFFIHKFSIPILYIRGGGDFGKFERYNFGMYLTLELPPRAPPGLNIRTPGMVVWELTQWPTTSLFGLSVLIVRKGRKLNVIYWFYEGGPTLRHSCPPLTAFYKINNGQRGQTACLQNKQRSTRTETRTAK